MLAEKKQVRRSDEIISVKSKLLLNTNMPQKIPQTSLGSKG